LRSSLKSFFGWFLLVAMSGGLLASCGSKPAQALPFATGLQASVNGWGFANFPSSSFPEINFDTSDVVSMFGSDATVCVGGKSDPCVLTAEAAAWAQMVNQSRASGHCQGLAVIAAQRFNENASPPTVKLRSGEETVHAVSRAFATQFLPEVQDEATVWINKSLSEKVDALSSSFKLKKTTYTLGLYNESGGHAVTPFAIEYPTKDIARIMIYDSNWPGRNRYVDVNLASKTWTFSFSGEDPENDPKLWKGVATDMDLSSVDVTNASCPFCGDKVGIKNTTLVIRSNSPDWSIDTGGDKISPAQPSGASGATVVKVKSGDGRNAFDYIVKIPSVSEDAAVQSSTKLNFPVAASVFAVLPKGIARFETSSKSSAPVVLAGDSISSSDPSVTLTLASGNLVASASGSSSTLSIGNDTLSLSMALPSGEIVQQKVDADTPVLKAQADPKTGGITVLQAAPGGVVEKIEVATDGSTKKSISNEKIDLTSVAAPLPKELESKPNPALPPPAERDMSNPKYRVDTAYESPKVETKAKEETPTTTTTPATTTTTTTTTTTIPKLAAPAFTLSSSSETHTVGTAITGYRITSTGGAISRYSLSPSAPAGMSFSTSTGLLSGSPTTVKTATEYLVTATNASGVAERTFTLTVTPAATTTTTTPATTTTTPATTTTTTTTPATTTTTTTTTPATTTTTTTIPKLAAPAFTMSSYSESVAQNSAIAGYTITSSGGVVASYSISPAAPAGMSFSTSTGLLSGTPTTVKTATEYVVTATNASGSAARTFTLTVTLPAPAFTMSSYSESVVQNSAITGYTITSSGGVVASYSISPAAPAGMSFSTSTGLLSGSPTTVKTATEYVVTATNASGSAARTFTLTVTDSSFIQTASGTSVTSPFSMKPLSDGSMIVIGAFSGSAVFGATTLSQGGTCEVSPFIARLSATGSWQWAQRVNLGPSFCTYLASGGDSPRFAMGVMTDDSIVVAAHFSGSVTLGATTLSNTCDASGGKSGIYVAKMNSQGEWLSARQSTGCTFDLNVQGLTVLQNDNSVVISGKYAYDPAIFGSTTLSKGTRFGGVGFVAKLNSNLEWQWAEDVEFFPGKFDVESSSSGDIFIFGDGNKIGSTLFGSFAWTDEATEPFVAKINSSGVEQWLTIARRTGAYQRGGMQTLTVQQDGTLIVGGTLAPGINLNGNIVPEGAKAYVGKLSPLGAWEWTTLFGGDYSLGIANVAVRPNGTIVVGEYHYYWFTPTFGSFTLPAPNEHYRDIAILEMSQGGSFTSAQRIGTSGQGSASIDDITDLAVRPDGTVVMIGQTSSATLTIGTRTISGTGSGNSRHLFIATL